MGEIVILDTGFVISTNEGTQASTANRAAGGTSITLKTASFIPNLKRNISNNPDLSSIVPSEVNLGSLENMKFRLRCLVDSNTDADTAKIADLIDCVRTNGYKLLWYDFTNATTEKNNGQLIFRIASNALFGDQLTAGELTNFGLTTQFVTLHVIFDNIQPIHSGTTELIFYEFSGTILKVEASTI